MSFEVIKETPTSSPDSMAMVREYLEGNARSGEELANCVRGILERRFRRLSATKAISDELVQDCMLQVFARLSEFCQEKGHFEAWVGGFAMNALRSHRRRESRSRISSIPVEEVQTLTYDITRQEDERELLGAALESLDLLDRELLHMRFSLGMSSEEIALSSNLNAPQVRKRISRAVERLRRHPAVGHILA